MLNFNDNRIHIDFGNSNISDNVEITFNGETINGVSRIQVDVSPNSLIETRLILHDVIIGNIVDGAMFCMIDPLDGKLKRVKNIEFEE